MNLLNEKARDDYEIKILRDHQVKIQPTSIQAYETVVNELQGRGTEFHTYKPKQDRSFRVVLKNMHPHTDTDEIKNAIEDNGHKVINIWNIKDRTTKQPLPLFFIDLKPSPNNREIYSVKHLLHCRIVFEAPRPKRDIPQCANGQRYEHTKRFCHRRPRCVKCAEEHLILDCPRKGRSDQVKCVLCNGNHPANYKRCAVFKEIQKVKFPPLRSRNTINPGDKRILQSGGTQEASVPGHKVPSYARVASSQKQTNHITPTHKQTKIIQQQPSYFQDFSNILQSVMNQLTAITKMMAELMFKLEHSSH